MKVIVVPLDERPCNYDYLLNLPLPKEVELVLPSRDLLSKKKDVCKIYPLHDWLFENAKDADYLVVSFDTLLYGGIIPSRLHHLEQDEILKRAEAVRKVKEINPKIKIFANCLIMRCPAYNCGDEEPDYFDEYGYNIFRYGQLLDKEKQGLISQNEVLEKENLTKKIPSEYLNDFISRRKKNLEAILKNLSYVKDGIIDFFIIPQDDCSEYGFTSIDQRKVKSFISKKKIDDKVVIYPGADEVGLTLMSRVLNDYYNYSPKFYVFYSSTLGSYSIPMFEDRPISETIKYHIYSTKGVMVSSISEADICLGINIGSEFLDKHDKRCYIVYGKNRNIPSFVDTISYILDSGKVCGIGDCAYCNEADKELLEFLKTKRLLFKLSSFAGWNTSSNTLGTTISNLTSYYYSKEERKKNISLINRYIDDFIYMAIVREKLIMFIEGEKINGINRFNLGEHKKRYETIAKEMIKEEVKNFSLELNNYIKDIDVDFIWNRTFEILLHLETNL